MERMMENLVITEEEEEEDLVVEDVESTELPNANLCLVGRFVSNHNANFNIIKSRIAGIWKPKKGIVIKDIWNGRILFQFYHVIDLRRVLDGCPWFFGGFPLIVHQLTRGEIPHSVPLNKLMFWVQVFNPSVGCFSESVGERLGNFIGRFIQYDESNKGAVWKNYMRIRVEIDVLFPLKRWKNIRMGNRVSARAEFKYEKPSPFCFVCGRLDHTESMCDDLYNSTNEEVVKGWGSWLKAIDRRGVLMQGERWLRPRGND
ncbi:hypothetical protein ACS0TY_033042 [Phlomoides rotata]